MAEKSPKTTKKSDSQTKKNEARLDVSQLPLPEQLKVKRQELLDTQRSFYDGTLHNPHAIRSLRREIARILTKLNATDDIVNDNVDNEEKGVN